MMLPDDNPSQLDTFVTDMLDECSDRLQFSNTSTVENHDPSKAGMEFSIETVSVAPLDLDPTIVTPTAIPPTPFEQVSSCSPGVYNFQVLFAAQKITGRTAGWVYSPAAGKLFANLGHVVPFQFQVRGNVPPNTFIRATPRCLRVENRSNVITRCPNHQIEKLAGANNCPKEHFIKCENTLAEYESTFVDHRKGSRCSVKWPFAPQAGRGTELLRFMCFSSCAGGLNRRPFEILFTLENGGSLLGSVGVETRICACPTRDLKAAEQKMAGGNPGVPGNGDSAPLKLKKRLSAPKKDDNRMHTLKVKGRTNYLILSQIVAGLDNSKTADDSNGKKAKKVELQAADAAGDTDVETEGDDDDDDDEATPKLPATHTVQDWLKVMKMDDYVAAFEKAGYDDLEVVGDLNNEDLNYIGVKLRGHRKKLLLGAMMLRKVLPATAIADPHLTRNVSISRVRFQQTQDELEQQPVDELKTPGKRKAEPPMLRRDPSEALSALAEVALASGSLEPRKKVKATTSPKSKSSPRATSRSPRGRSKLQKQPKTENADQA